MKDIPSPNYQPRPSGQVIDMVILHYTGMQTGMAALKRLCDPQSGVSAHYMIEEDGMILRMVDEYQRAWHAGQASWHQQHNINDRSIGIELVNPGHDFGYRRFPESQMIALETLLGDIVTRHAIPPPHILGHSDIAPDRKRDPGELFDWQRLAQKGLGLWPNLAARKQPAKKQPETEPSFLSKLAAYGYPVADKEESPREGATPHQIITAFERHFRPWNLSGHIDPENRRRLDDLLAQLKDHQNT